MTYRERIVGCLFLSGPTAGGKTDLGIKLAQRIGAEIVSLDSMAVYRSLNIGTAKPPPEQQAIVPHHLIDIVDPAEDFSLARYLTAAKEAVDDIHSRKKKVLFVGGTPLYLKGVLRGIFDGPGADESLRRDLENKEQYSPGILHRMLSEIDGETATRLHPHDLRRIVRAIEVYKLTGQPISLLQRQFERPAGPEEAKVVVLEWDRPILYERINRRVDLMIEAGWIEEAQQLLAANSLGKTASQAVGYRELFAMLRGELSRNEAIERIKQFTRNFAKSQMTWFRSLQEVRFIPVNSETAGDELLEKVCINYGIIDKI